MGPSNLLHLFLLLANNISLLVFLLFMWQIHSCLWYRRKNGIMGWRQSYPRGHGCDFFQYSSKRATRSKKSANHACDFLSIKNANFTLYQRTVGTHFYTRTARLQYLLMQAGSPVLLPEAANHHKQPSVHSFTLTSVWFSLHCTSI
jgi:hypothetical protein